MRKVIFPYYFNINILQKLPNNTYFLKESLPNNSKNIFYNQIILHTSVFSTWKSLWELQKARIKIVARAIYTYLFFLIHTLLFFCDKITSFLIAAFLSKLDHRPLFNNILWNFSRGRIDFNMNNKCHTLPLYAMLV